tara:strand:+ start:2736 stop:3161 length:426 start_codon:yes stop_codon:yes gene_type:complete
MKKSELKKVLKPLVKECIKEAILEEGILSNIISEVVQGLSAAPIVETRQAQARETQRIEQMEEQQLREGQEKRQKLQETRKRMLDAIGRDSYGGVDLFEGTTAPVESDPAGPLAGTDPGDAGVDISQIFGGTSKHWSNITK